MTPRPQKMAWVSPALAAVCKYEPSPGRRKSRAPSTNISQAIRKNHPPATDIIEFQQRRLPQSRAAVMRGQHFSVNGLYRLHRGMGERPLHDSRRNNSAFFLIKRFAVAAAFSGVMT